MAHTTSYPRPISLFQPPTPTFSSVDHLTPLRRPPSPVSHPRLLSRHNSEPTESSQRRRSIIRSPSLASMGFRFNRREGEKEGSSKKASHSSRSFGNSPTRAGSPSTSVTLPLLDPSKHATERPSASNGLLTLPKERGLKKKRSLASLLSVASEHSHATSAFSSRSGSSSPVHIPRARSLLGVSQSLQLSPVKESNVTHGASVKASGDGQRPPRRQPTNNFVRKDTWLKRQNMKVHPYPLEATYMQAYDPLQLENDRYTDILLRRLNPLRSPSFHNYGRKIPLYVLDLGCGSGHWLLEASSAWKTSQITGFDLVDTLVPGVFKQGNINFVRGNFLRHHLPFANKSFDFVRMANLTLCIPYDKWEFVLSEVHRVLTIDGRLELIDDQIFFPYGPSPAMPTPMQIDKEASLFGEDDEDTLKDDSTGEGDSMETDSTLISEPDFSSSHDQPKQTTVLELRDNNFLRPPLPKLLMPLTPIDHDTREDPIATPYPPMTIPSASWSLQAAASRDMETVFQNMLNHKFGIHTRPSDFVVDMMKDVFGNGRKLKSFHLKLAPRDSCTIVPNSSSVSSGGSVEGGSDKDDKTSRIKAKVTAQKINEIARPWFTVEWDNEERKKPKRERKWGKSDSAAHRRAAEGGLRPHTPDISIPGSINAKAAGRLGIREDTSKRPSFPEKNHGAPPDCLDSTRERKSSEVRDTPPIPEKVRETTVPIETIKGAEGQADMLHDPIPSVDSTKAGSGLGNSHSTLSAATATPARDRRSFSSFSSTCSTTSQSPGLLLWPATFLPLSPLELEMHACKHVHTLLGCKPALAEFIDTYVDEHGTRSVSDEEFDQAIWDYECFRRRRFHWPSEIPEWDQDPLDEWDTTPTASSPYISNPKSGTYRALADSNSEVFSTSPFNISASSPRPYTVDELCHVRTLRIFEAVKTNGCTFTSLKYPRPPPPIPPPKA